jgi:hypothetical protein
MILPSLDGAFGVIGTMLSWGHQLDCDLFLFSPFSGSRGTLIIHTREANITFAAGKEQDGTLEGSK